MRQSGRPSRAVLVLALALVAALTAACAGTPSRAPVSAAAVAFVSAVVRGDGSAACRALTPDARQSVTGATNVSCSKAIESVDEKGHAVSSVQVWGDAAQVHVGEDVVFLRQLSGRWLVSAAGCVRQAQGPYDCDVGA